MTIKVLGARPLTRRRGETITLRFFHVFASFSVDRAGGTARGKTVGVFGLMSPKPRCGLGLRCPPNLTGVANPSQHENFAYSVGSPFSDLNVLCWSPNSQTRFVCGCRMIEVDVCFGLRSQQ